MSSGLYYVCCVWGAALLHASVYGALRAQGCMTYALSPISWLPQKLSRKLVHMTSGPLYIAMWPLFSREPWARYCAAIICVFNALR